MKVHTLAILLICVSVPFVEPLPNIIRNATKTTRIVGGIVAQRNEFPFIISYQTIVDRKHFCGGSILTKDWILTSAHCTFKRPSETMVVAGLLNLGEIHPDVQTVLVAQQIIHPQYPGGAQAAPNDIGLLKLAWSLQFTWAVKPIPLPYANQEHSGYAWTAGWGYTSSDNPVSPIRLQQVEMLLISTDQCANDLISIVGNYGPLNENMICVRGANTGKETTCFGDSGGPLVQQTIPYYIIGVNSWTLQPCGIYKAPSVFTKVSKYLQFIRYYVPGV